MDPLYHSILKGKSIAIVGGHNDVDWARVNKCDLVVRINDHYPRQGGRLDILYHHCGDEADYSMFAKGPIITTKFIWLNRMQCLFGPSRFSWLARYCHDNKITWAPYYHAPKSCFDLVVELKGIPDEDRWPEDFSEVYDVYAFTGVLALHHLTLYPIRSIYVDGMTFYQEEGVTPVRFGCHSIPKQVDYVNYLRLHDGRVSYSEVLLKAIDKPKYDKDFIL